MAARYRITVTGVVQGVGFRPFIKRLADRFELPGTVVNTTGGVVIEVEAEQPALAHAFASAIRVEAPAVARIARLELTELGKPVGYRSFTILASRPAAGSFTLISADIASCPDCLRETADANNRRFRYPFTNCTNCGPRYSITMAVPYDRENTTMAAFTMCPRCLAEYENPGDRRFHAEPNACPVCGPRLTIEPYAADALSAAISALENDRILAVKGLGGFQLACNARSETVVDRLRTVKRRSRKPFAVMMRDAQTIDRYCRVSACELALLQTGAAPIVLMQVRLPHSLPAGIAPGLTELGVMLPCTPLHHLLFRNGLDCLVMTSGNISEEPIVIANDDARRKLTGLSDVLLLHDREIFMRVDDSVVRVHENVPRVLRRARGYAPEAIDLAFDAGEVLACGAELKNTFCLTKSNYAILSQHIGDMENVETLEFFEESLRNLKQVYRANPRVLA
ncbi:MAG: carbamoyltransferase HypF, partial [Acidobacteriota bacterium]|nr:carbamoyltransferase HypF [Acidobacteriota bacterium]